MESNRLSKPFELINAHPNIDLDYGCYNSIAAAEAAIPITMRKAGRTVGIYVGGVVIEYWWNNDSVDVLVPKQTNQAYKSYVAIISQSGTNAPVVESLLIDEILGGVTWEYISQGLYFAIAREQFVENKTTVHITNGVTTTAVVTGSGVIDLSDSIVQINCTRPIASLQRLNSVLQRATIEIRVYNN
jgi:hypothetical protein